MSKDKDLVVVFPKKEEVYSELKNFPFLKGRNRSFSFINIKDHDEVLIKGYVENRHGKKLQIVIDCHSGKDSCFIMFLTEIGRCDYIAKAIVKKMTEIIGPNPIIDDDKYENDSRMYCWASSLDYEEACRREIKKLLSKRGLFDF